MQTARVLITPESTVQVPSLLASLYFLQVSEIFTGFVVVCWTSYCSTVLSNMIENVLYSLGTVISLYVSKDIDHFLRNKTM